MFKISLKGLWSRKRRLASTMVAVLLGVAFVSGTLVLSDTMRASFTDFFTDANEGIDAQVRSEQRLDTEVDTYRGSLDHTLVDQVSAVDGVAAAAPSISGYGRLVGSDGKALGGNGPPTLAGNWIEDPDLSAWRLSEGRAPETDTEVVIDRASAKEGDLQVGDTTTVQTPEAVEVTVVGIAKFGTADSSGPVTYTFFTLEGAQEHVTKQPNQISTIVVEAADGVSQSELVSNIDGVLPAGVEAISGTALTDEQLDDINSDFLGAFTTILLVFAGVAMLVATFSIYNTFSIIVAQRSRESALFRAVGASRKQVLSTNIAEAVAVGVVASIVGFGAGLGLATGLKALLSAFGFGIPADGLTIKPSAVIISLVIGTVVTVGAGLLPAMRASKVPPLAALRDVAVEKVRPSAIRVVAGIATTGIGVATVLASVLGGGGGNTLAFAGLGAVATIVGVVVTGPVVARPLSAVLGAPLRRLKGVTGGLAQQNAMRNPRRTSGTAAALMIGVGVVTLFTVFGASLKASLNDTVQQSFGGDLAIRGGNFGVGGLDPALADAVAERPEVADAVGLGQGQLRLEGSDTDVTVADPARLEGLLDLDVTAGDFAALSDTQIAVAQDKADDKGWQVGDQVSASFVDGSSATFTIGALFDSTGVTGNYVLSRGAWAPHAVQTTDALVLINLADGVSVDAGRAAVEQVVGGFAGADVQDRDEYAASYGAQIDQILALVYIMLALAIVIALMGIANTLSLSIHERRRELGLLRAVGVTRAQVRSMVRWESVIIALFGTIGGLGLGVFLGWALVQAAGDENIALFSVPSTQLVVVLVVGAIAGIVAALRPARRAARLDVLAAIAAD